MQRFTSTRPYSTRRSSKRLSRKPTKQSILCRKSVGNKGKGEGGADNKLTPADLLIGLSGDGKGSYLKSGYPIEAKQFYAKYQEHLIRLVDHILRPTVML